MISSFFLSRGTVYIVTCVTLVAVVAIRMAVLVIMEMIKAKKEQNSEENVDSL